MRHRHRQPDCMSTGGAGAPRTLVLITMLLASLAGCIPHYSDFVGAQDSRADQVGDAGATDGRSADALDTFDSHADTTDGKDVQDVPDVDFPTCGDGECNGTESCDSCPVDCGDCCGNQACDYGETCDTCPADCGGPCCGQGGCQTEFGEDKCNCPEDCGDPCTGTECGTDGCGGECGDCALLYGEQYVCDAGTCECILDCEGKDCGSDGCGGTCGSCQAPMVCADGVCIGCGDDQCGAGEHKCNCPEDCTGGCSGCCSDTACKTGNELEFCGVGGEACDECMGGEECEGGDCVCTVEHHQACSGGKLYWYDSCNVQGSLVNNCDDGNACTTDGCSGSQCTHSNVQNDTPCGNEKTCQSGACSYKCGDGVCASTPPGTETQCSCAEDCGGCAGCCSGSVCKAGTLTSECGKNGAACVACSGGKKCQNQACVCAPNDHQSCSAGKLYWYDSCNVQGSQVNNCDDGNACTTDGCSGSQCTYSNVQNDMPCGNEKTCQSGACSYKCGDGVCASTPPGTETCTNCPGDCGQCPGQCTPSCDPTLEECVQATTGGWACAAKMVEIPAGNFWMGCNNCAGSSVNDTSCGSDEHPYHEVHLDAYEIDRTEVTAAQYLACKNAGGCSAAGTGSYATYEVPGKEDHPINRVNWYQAEDYCLWTGKQLCTEAQWEKGARGGCEKNGGPSNCKAQSRKYPWGNETATCDLAVMSGCDGDTQPVCSRSPAGDSPYGLCDMAGNVWEWTADWYGSDYYCAGSGADTSSPWTDCTACGSWPGSPNAWSNPFGTISGSYRVVRGGSWYYVFDYLRVSGRYFYFPSYFFDFILGLRCCRSE